MKSYWLVKSEPSTYSWTTFITDKGTSWTGVRNYKARNNLRAMRKGDEVFFYHSGEDKAVVGTARVGRTAYADPTATEDGWSTVDLVPIKTLRSPVTLAAIKKNPKLRNMVLVHQSRLSVSPLTAPEFREVVRMATP